MNKAERWHRVSALFDRVVDLPAAEREALLAAECADDPPLRQEVERLLQADERTNPVDRDIAGHASLLLLEGDPHEHEGQRFGPYRIVRLLAQGGMGRVYLAEREGEDFAQTVALKLVGGYGSFDAYNARRRFLDERRILARLQHPNIARLLDGGVGPEAQPWFAMEYVDGAPLTECCDAQRLGVRERLQLFAKVCEAVDHAHRFLIVHRDLKPGNVLVDGRGEPKVLDFGIAKLLDEGAPADRTGSTVLMTPDYAAPEQIRGGQISTATDVYALGAVLFELLTGRKPFVDPLAPRDAPQASKAATEGQRTGERAQARATTPQALRKHLRGDLDRILRTALDPDPARRYRSAEALGQDLRAVAEGKAISLRSDRRYRMGVFLRRHKWETAAAAVAMLGLLGTTGWALRQTQQATLHAQASAQHAREEASQAAIARKEALTSEKVSALLISAFAAADPGQRTGAKEPTAKDVLDAGAASVSEELADTPEVRARMQTMLGRAYLNIGRQKQAKDLLESAITTYKSQTVGRPDLASEAIYMLAIVEMNDRHRQRAIDLAKESLEIRKKYGFPVEEVLVPHNILGMALISPGYYAEAERVFAENYALRAKHYGIPSFEVAVVLNNRGRLAIDSGMPREAERMLREGLDMKYKVRDKPNSVYRTLSLLALALSAQGKFVDAERNGLQSIEIALTLYADDSSQLAALKERLGSIYYQQGDMVRAMASYREAVEIEKRASNLTSGNAASFLGSLAEAEAVQGEYANAERNYKAAVDLLQKSLPASDPDLLRAQARLEVHRAKRGVGGNDRLDALLARWIAAFGPDREHIPPDLAEALFLNAEHRIATNRMKGIESTLPPHDAQMEQPMMQARREYLLARIAAQRGDAGAAMAGYRQALAIADKTAGPNSAWAAFWRLDYAEALAASGRRRDAAAQLALSEAVLKVQLVGDAPALGRVRRLRDSLAS